MNRISMTVLLVLTLIAGVTTIHLYVSGVLVIRPLVLITAVSSGSAASLVLVFSLGAVGMLTSWVLAQKSVEL